MDYQEALAYLQSLTDYEKKTGYSYSPEIFDLRRPRALLALLGNPQERFPSVVVAGTKGKGSTSAMVASILRASGRRVGLYSQPHLHSFRERIRVDGELISRTELAGAIQETARAMERFPSLHPELGMPTSYEVATAAALLYFADQRPDLAVLEVGLGGRLDAVNVVSPLVSVITPISLDHTQLLGNSLAEIAAEKAGIIKEGGVVVSAGQPEEAMEVIRRVALERGARLVVAASQIREEDAPEPANHPNGAARPRRERSDAVVGGPSGSSYRVRIPLLGSHQLSNAATAIAVVEELARRGFPADQPAVEEGLRRVEWPGRLEIVSREPLVVVDGAHNGDSARKLAAALEKEFVYRRLLLVLGTSADKDLEGIISALAPAASAVVATRSRHARAADPARIAELARLHCPMVEIAQDVPSAIARALAMAAPRDLVCVTGSLFIVADARDHFGLARDKD